VICLEKKVQILNFLILLNDEYYKLKLNFINLILSLIILLIFYLIKIKIIFFNKNLNILFFNCSNKSYLNHKKYFYSNFNLY
jgi:hypothetical protein